MITESAIVVRSEGKRVELRLQRSSACGACELQRGCGTGALGRLLGHRSKAIVIETEHRLQVGDALLLGLQESALVKLSLWIYGMPLLGMLVAGLSATLTTTSDVWVALATLGGFLLGYRYALYTLGKLESRELNPYILNIQVNPGSLP